MSSQIPANSQLKTIHPVEEAVPGAADLLQNEAEANGVVSGGSAPEAADDLDAAFQDGDAPLPESSEAFGAADPDAIAEDGSYEEDWAVEAHPAPEGADLDAVPLDAFSGTKAGHVVDAEADGDPEFDSSAPDDSNPEHAPESYDTDSAADLSASDYQPAAFEADTGLSASMPAEAVGPHHADQAGARQTDNLARILSIACLAFALLLAGAMGGAFWFYQVRIAPRLIAGAVPASSEQGQAHGSAPEPASAPAPVPAPVPPPAAAIVPLQRSLEQAVSRLADLQKQLEAEHAARSRSDQQMQEMSARISELVLKQNSLQARSGAAGISKTEPSGMPAMTPTLTPSVSELVLLKERNRLAAYADEAIATGRRDSLQAIVDAMLDPAMKQLHFAAQAEFKRVQSYYNFSISIDPSYTLPVRELFKGPLIRSEKDLTPSELTKILLDHQQPWEARLRSAFLLRTSTEPDTDRALLRAIKEDPSLDVAKQAQTTFEKLVGRKFHLFDIPAIEAWWQMQGNLLLSAPPASKSDG